MTEKENYLRLLRGEQPEWLPRFTLEPPGLSDRPPCTVHLRPSCLNRINNPDGTQTDYFGVLYENDKNGGAFMPSPHVHILDDIRHWRDVIKAPEYNNIDWGAMAAKDLENVDRENSAVALVVGAGYFQALVSFLGFESALMAPLEEEDEVIELLSYLSDFFCGFTKKAIEYYKPDVLAMADDNASALAPFFSLDMYRNIFKPFQAKEAMLGAGIGLPVSMHDCGHCELYIDDWMDFGVRIWNPAQISNDLLGIKEKYKGRLVLAGCWDSQGKISFPTTGEAETRAAVREYVDTYAPGGGFCFSAGVYGNANDPIAAEKQRWITDEYEKYGRNWYQNH